MPNTKTVYMHHKTTTKKYPHIKNHAMTKIAL